MSCYVWASKKFLDQCSSTSNSSHIIGPNPIQHKDVINHQASFNQNGSLGKEVELCAIEVEDTHGQTIAGNTVERKDNDIHVRVDNIGLQLQNHEFQFEIMKLQIDKLTKTVDEVIWKIK